MNEADKKPDDRDNFHPMQNIHIWFIRLKRTIRYSDKDNDGCHECDSLKRLTSVKMLKSVATTARRTR